MPCDVDSRAEEHRTADRSSLAGESRFKLRDWNTIASLHEHSFRRGFDILTQFGAVARTRYFNVVVMKVGDKEAFLRRLAALVANVPDVLKFISRVVPLAHTFEFTDAQDFEAKARTLALEWLPRLAHNSFHVRLHRRGLRDQLNSKEAEQHLDVALRDALAAAGMPGRIEFKDPDLVIDVETLGNRAGLSIWTREELLRYPFLRVD
jgi:tRNA(Ser,Leu) C12 N-acetylase TAN1